MGTHQASFFYKSNNLEHDIWKTSNHLFCSYKTGKKSSPGRDREPPFTSTRETLGESQKSKKSKDSVNNTSNPIEITINKTDKSQIPNNLPWDKISWGINLTVHECLERVYNLLKLPLVHRSMGEAKWKKMEICANFQCCPILCKAI